MHSTRTDSLEGTMKVRISYVVEVDDTIRRAMRHYYGQNGLATRDEIKQWYEQNGGTLDDDALAELDAKGLGDED